jgi:rhodanese-related sulfurtransferase
MDIATAVALLADGRAVALDVREPREWHAGRIPSSLHVPMRELGGRLDELPRSRKLIAVCRSGKRSAAVTDALRQAGFDVENLDGGLRAWARGGLPLEPSGGRVA